MDQKILKSILYYNPLNGRFFWRTREGNKNFNSRLAGKEAGTIKSKRHQQGYIRIKLGEVTYAAHRLAWLYHYGEWPEDCIDHINHVRDDNRIENLRGVKRIDNNYNRTITKKNKSGCVGVSYMQRDSVWRASIYKNKKQIHLGIFKNKNDAIAARKKAELKYGYHYNHGKV